MGRYHFCGQAALRRACGRFRRSVRPAERRAARPLAALRRVLPARLLTVRLTRKARAGFALRLLFMIFAICFSLSVSLSCNTCPVSNRDN